MMKQSIFLQIILILFSICNSQISIADNNNFKKALILFDGENTGTPGTRPFGWSSEWGEEDAKMLSNLLGHFKVKREIKPVLQYKSKEIENYDLIFYVAFLKSDKFNVPNEFLKDLYSTKKTVCWINNQIDQFDKKFGLNKFGFKFIKFDEKSGFNKVIYKHTELDKGDIDTNIVRIINDKICKAFALTKNKNNVESPYIIKGNNLWFVADSPFSYLSERDRYFVFADCLHDIVEEFHPEKHSAIIRIEDVNPSEEDILPNFKKIVDFLSKEKIPFVISLIPIYRDPHSNTEIYLSDKPKLVNFLKYAIERGASIAMHGLTHQYHGESADDYEFWDDLANPPYGSPISGDSEKYVSNKIEHGIAELLNCGIYPVFWETPHYMASQLDYSVFGKYFNTFLERRSVGDYIGADQILPYFINKDFIGKQVIPENIGYIKEEDTVDAMNNHARKLIENAKANLVVRDGFASAFFHPFIDVEVLKTLVKGIKSLGYEYIDVKNYNMKVETQNTVIITGKAKIEVNLNEQYVHEFYINSAGNFHKEYTSKDKITGEIKRSIECPKGYIYVFNKMYHKPQPWFNKVFNSINRQLVSFVKYLTKQSQGAKLKEPPSIIIVWDNLAKGGDYNNQLSYLNSLKSLGIDINRVNIKDLFSTSIGRYKTIIIPYKSALKLSKSQIDILVSAVEAGLVSLITEGDTLLAEKLGIYFANREIPVEVVEDDSFPDLNIEWQNKVSVAKIKEANIDKTFYIDKNTKTPIIAGIKCKKGKVLFLATQFDPESGYGYKRFPYFFIILKNYLGIIPVVKRENLEVYFDPGYRQEISIERLAKMWKINGVKAVHVGSWHFYNKYVYDYERLIKVCHQNSILVYAWFELPQVSEKFWNLYPNWREITAKLQEAHNPEYSWRYLMGLMIPECKKKIFKDIRTFLTKYDWDGVNVAELYFDSLTGPDNPEFFTPMNEYVRRDFKYKYGFDPVEIFNNSSDYYWENNENAWRTFADYRINLVAELHNEVLYLLESIKKEKVHLDIIVTAIDTLHDNKLKDNIGLDVRRIIELQKKYDFTLQVEDPAPMWVTGPERYLKIGDEYDKLINDKSRMMLDINIVQRRYILGTKTFPTDLQVGQEILQLVSDASRASGKVCMYAESTISQTDFPYLAYAMANLAEEDKLVGMWHIKSPYSVDVDVGNGFDRIEVDAEPWFIYNEGIVSIPAGEHEIKPVRIPFNYLDTSSLDVRILKITGEIIDAKKLQRGVLIEYESTPRCFIIINKKPYDIYLDGIKSEIPILRCDDGYTLMCPAGNHKVTIHAQSTSLYWVEFVGLFSSSLIVAFGFTTSGLLIILYIAIQIKRKLRKH